jgi:pimeloyl-ACP methyl ester carboxylesterase
VDDKLGIDMPNTHHMQRISVEGGELEYEARGDGEPVLFIHGAHIAASYAPIMEEAALTSYRLIRYHRRGYADSTPAEGPPSTYIARAAADAAALLERLGIERAHVVGHSSGGLIALQLALDSPELLHSLVLMEPALVGVPSGAAHVEALGPVVGRYQKGDPAGAVDGFLAEVCGREWRTKIPRVIPGAAQQAERDAATFFELELLGVGAWTLDELKAADLTLPVLYVLGSESLPYLGEGKELIRSWFAQTEDCIVKGANHALQMQEPQAVAEEIADFFGRHRSKRRAATD